MINIANFEKKIDNLLKQKDCSAIAVAVSGGADSLCLTFLLYEWCKKKDISLYAFTVDHNLRPESAKEAQYVHDLLTEKGIIHETLSWTGQKPETGIEEKARQARYELLFNACRKNNISCLFLAHHQNDQAETFLMRLVRSSGVDGLSAIQSVSSREGIFLLRPMLDYSRLQIQETLKKHFSVSWVEDPSNNQIIYERVRLRQAQDFFDNLGLTASSISLSAKRLSRARFALEKMASDFISQFCRKNEAGFIFIDGKNFENLPEEIKLRVLDVSMAFVVGEKYQSRMSQLEKMLEQLPCRLTLHECQIVSTKKGIYICPEFSKMPEPIQLKAGQIVAWGRFNVSCSQDVTIGPLGDRLKIKGLPALVRRTIPAFFDKKGLAFVPSLDYKRKNTDIDGTILMKD